MILTNASTMNSLANSINERTRARNEECTREEIQKFVMPRLERDASRGKFSSAFPLYSVITTDSTIEDFVKIMKGLGYGVSVNDDLSVIVTW